MLTFIRFYGTCTIGYMHLYRVRVLYRPLFFVCSKRRSIQSLCGMDGIPYGLNIFVRNGPSIASDWFDIRSNSIPLVVVMPVRSFRWQVVLRVDKIKRTYFRVIFSF